MLHLLATWTHDLAPFAWRVSGDFGIRWYGLSYVAGFILAWLVLRALAKRKLILLKPEDIPDLILAQVIGVMVGGRLGYVLFYQPALLLDFSPHFPWWGVLDITSGGMSSHGGMLGVFAAAAWSARRFKVPSLHVLDCIASVVPLGIFLGRIANFVNAELLGSIVAKPGEPAPWWAVRYPTELLERTDELNYTSEQHFRLLEVVSTYVGPGAPLSRESFEVLVAKIQGGDAGAKAALEPLLSARHPSQFYQAVAEGLVTFAVIWFVWRKPRRPGVISAAFLITYAIGRIATEFIRLPDAHLATQRFLALSRGQWLSVVMIVFAAAFLAVAYRRKDAPLAGGWLTREAVAEASRDSPADVSGT